MKRLILLTLLLWTLGNAMAQQGLYDYLYIQSSTFPEVKVISTEAETRIVRIDFPKGQGAIEPTVKVILALVQEYESKGWSLFTIAQEGSQAWVMRKPKP